MSNWSGWGDEDEDEEEQETGPVSYMCVCIIIYINICYETAVIAAWALIRIVTMIGSLCDQGLSDIVD